MSTTNGWLSRLRDSGTALLVARLIVGGLFIYVSLDKLKDPAAFLKVVKEYQVVPLAWYPLLNGIAVIVPWIELLGGIALIVGLGLRGVGTVFLVMLIGFTSAIGLRTWNVMHTEGISFWNVAFDCGCGTGSTIIWKKMLENGGLILLSLLIAISRSQWWCLASRLQEPDMDQAALEIHSPAASD